MPRSLCAFFLFLLVFLTAHPALARRTYVRSYVRKDGTYVRGHYRGTGGRSYTPKSSSGSVGGLVDVKGYFRKDGTYVRPHVRTKPDGIESNNLSYSGSRLPAVPMPAPTPAPSARAAARSPSTASPGLPAVIVPGADLRNVKAPQSFLSQRNLYGVNFSGADLSGANLAGAILTDARFVGAHLVRANLRGTKLIGADLSRAKLTGAELQGADLSDAVLTGADVTGAQFTPATRWPKGFSALLAGAVLDASTAGARAGVTPASEPSPKPVAEEPAAETPAAAKPATAKVELPATPQAPVPARNSEVTRLLDEVRTAYAGGHLEQVEALVLKVKEAVAAERRQRSTPPAPSDPGVEQPAVVESPVRFKLGEKVFGDVSFPTGTAYLFQTQNRFSPALDRYGHIRIDIPEAFAVGNRLFKVGEQVFRAKYTSSNPKVATVAEDGAIELLEEGECTLQVELGEVRVRVPVKVVRLPVAAFSKQTGVVETLGFPDGRNGNAWSWKKYPGLELQFFGELLAGGRSAWGKGYQP